MRPTAKQLKGRHSSLRVAAVVAMQQAHSPEGLMAQIRASRGLGAEGTPLTMTNTIAALVEYDASQEARDKLLNDAKTDADVAAWQVVEDAADEAVRRAFWEDTKDRNSLDTILQCKISFSFMRRCCAKAQGLPVYYIQCDHSDGAKVRMDGDYFTREAAEAEAEVYRRHLHPMERTAKGFTVCEEPA